MNIKGNTLKIVAGAMLMASLPAGAQILGGGLTGAAGGMLGGGLGASGIHGAGSGAGNAGVGATGSLGTLRDRVGQTAGQGRDVATSTATDAGSRVEAARGTTDATAQAAHASSVNAGRQATDTASRGANENAGNAAQPAPPAAPILAPESGGNLLLGGSASAEKKVMGRNASAKGSGSSATSANRDGLVNNSNGQADVGLTKDEPVPAEPAAE